MIYTKYILFSLLLVCPSVLSAQGITRRIHQIDEVTVWGKRPMKEIGVQKTKFDSLALKENIALSMADILTFNSSVFVKSYGRATLSTVAFRGTSPSHTQVTWNGMRINNPMLGMTDFSTIPSYFIDQASLLHGTSSVNETGGGLGGLQQHHADDRVSGQGMRRHLAIAPLEDVQGQAGAREQHHIGQWEDGEATRQLVGRHDPQGILCRPPGATGTRS